MKKLIALACLSVAVLSGCRLDMHNQPKYKPLRISEFYSDKRSSRPIIEGTVARGQLKADTYFYTGKVGNNVGEEFPFPITEQVMQRGHERFNIYCSPCHSELGDGNGMIVQRGFRRPPSYHIERLRKAPVGHFFDVMTNGFGVMPDYASQIPVKDRWAIVAYIRALQASQSGTAADLPAGTQISKSAPDIIHVGPGPKMESTKGTPGESGNLRKESGEHK